MAIKQQQRTAYWECPNEQNRDLLPLHAWGTRWSNEGREKLVVRVGKQGFVVP